MSPSSRVTRRGRSCCLQQVMLLRACKLRDILGDSFGSVHIHTRVGRQLQRLIADLYGASEMQ